MSMAILVVAMLWYGTVSILCCDGWITPVVLWCLIQFTFCVQSNVALAKRK